MRMKKAVVVLLLFTTQVAVGQKQLAPLPIKEAFKSLNFPGFIPISLSPEGKLVAYTLQDISRKNQTADAGSPSYDLTRTGVPRDALYCDIWINDLDAGTKKNLTEGKGNSWGPVWSPDGKSLAFYSDRSGFQSLWIWKRSSGEMRRVSEAIIRTRTETMMPRWTPDSRKLVVKLLPEGLTVADVAAMLTNPDANAKDHAEKETGSTVVLYSARTANTPAEQERERVRQNRNLEAYAVDLAVVDVNTGKTERLARKILADNWWISPDGTNIALMIFKGRESHGTLKNLWDLSVISLVDGKQKILVSNVATDVLIPVSWSPNGKMLAYVTLGPKVANDCWVVSVNGGEPRNLTPGDQPTFDGTFLYRGALWDSTSEHLYLISKNSLWRASVTSQTATAITTFPDRTLRDVVSADGRTIWSPAVNSVVAVTRDEQTKREGLYRINLANGKYELILEEDRSYGMVPLIKTAISADGSRMVYGAQSASEPEELWTTNARFDAPQKVTNIHAVFDRYVMGKGRIIEWKTLDGATAYGAVLLPAGYQPGKRYPLIVYQYPGARLSRWANFFGFSPFASPVENWQLLATRGYAVLLPDVQAKPETYMQDIAKQVLPGVDKVIELGIADPERVGVTGQSDGGYGTLGLIVQTTRFKAALARAGMGNLISQYTYMTDNGTSAYTAEMLIRTGGSLWEKRERFIENSPIFYFDRVQTPVLLVHGTADTQAPPVRSDEVFVALRTLGKEVEYARYTGESHGVAEWSYPNQVDYLNRMIGWFDRWLKPASD
jgi:dipeptidyl aminopeptidase/acylaminoacyl peptidase